MKGIVFDIKQFALYDGPGIRDTVFMKGCPLRCQWCHNPEGLSAKPELMVSKAACVHCGECEAVCQRREQCVACGRCVPYCRKSLRRVAGDIYTPESLSRQLLRDGELLSQSGGGVTFSGGEPLMQWDFVEETIHRLKGLHTAIETSGYAADDVFERMTKAADLIIMDLKAMDDEVHRRFTGVSNQDILRHARMLKMGEKPFIIRIPVIPGVNDNTANFSAAASMMAGAKHLIRVELLPYHKTAGAKYAMIDRDYAVHFNPDRPVHIDLTPFAEHRLEACVL